MFSMQSLINTVSTQHMNMEEDVYTFEHSDKENRQLVLRLDWISEKFLLNHFGSVSQIMKCIESEQHSHQRLFQLSW